MSDAYWHFYENYNPAFCPGKKFGEGMSMSDRFKESRSCLRPCSCDECRSLNIDKEIDIPEVNVWAERIDRFMFTFHNWYFIWFIISSALFAISLSNLFVTHLWYLSTWLLLAIPSGFLFFYGAWITFHLVGRVGEVY